MIGWHTASAIAELVLDYSRELNRILQKVTSACGFFSALAYSISWIRRADSIVRLVISKWAGMNSYFCCKSLSI
jgi:hypothetical protein